MKTNLEKWNHYKAKIKAKEQTYIEDELGDYPQKTLWGVYPIGEVFEVFVVGRGYKHDVNVHCFTKKPTRKDVERIKNYALSDIGFTRDKIRINCNQISEYTSMGQRTLEEVEHSYYKSKAEAEQKALEITEKNRNEKELIESGTHHCCCYCSKVRPKEQIIFGTIVSRNWERNGYTSPKRAYCKDGGCHGYDQMAHEG